MINLQNMDTTKPFTTFPMHKSLESTVRATYMFKPKTKATQKPLKEAARFKCPLCEKCFTRSGTLQDHSRVHSKERPFECNTCGKKFSRLKDKNRHQKLHEGGKIFVCRGRLRDSTQWGCGRGFSREDGLVAHLRTGMAWSCIKPCRQDLGRLWGERGGQWRCRFSRDENRKDATGCRRAFPTKFDLQSHLWEGDGGRCLRRFIEEKAMVSARLWRKEHDYQGDNEGSSSTTDEAPSSTGFEEDSKLEHVAHTTNKSNIPIQVSPTLVECHASLFAPPSQLINLEPIAQTYVETWQNYENQLLSLPWEQYIDTNTKYYSGHSHIEVEQRVCESFP